jgi:hypothetical protein
VIDSTQATFTRHIGHDRHSRSAPARVFQVEVTNRGRVTAPTSAGCSSPRLLSEEAGVRTLAGPHAVADPAGAAHRHDQYRCEATDPMVSVRRIATMPFAE